MHIEVRTENITPEKAEKYLNENKGNRKLRDGIVEKYAYDMKHGKWTECPVPITFYDNGDVADGQHRLWAIVESGCTTQFLVARGLPQEAGLNLDSGLPRSLVDNARISGINTHLSNAMLSASRFYMEGGIQRHTLSNARKMEFVDTCREPIGWTLERLHGRGFLNAPTAAAIARAYASGVDKERLEQFVAVLTKGFSNGVEDAAAIALRNYIMSRGSNISKIDARDYFLKAQNAIVYFLKRKPLNLIKTVKEEAFPLKSSQVGGKKR